MVNDEVWAEARMNEPYSGQLCISCLEVRLNRELKSCDFPNLPINVARPSVRANKTTRKRKSDMSELLYARINGLVYTKEPESKTSSV